MPELLPKLMNTALHLFVEGESEFGLLICQFIQQFSQFKSIFFSAFKAIFESIPKQKNLKQSVQLLRSFNQSNSELMKSVWETLNFSNQTEIIKLLLKPTLI
jgi:hypothetical protein